MSPVRARLDATRWHFQHGPIDLVLSANGHDDAIELAWARFQPLLDELVRELGTLRRAVADATVVRGTVARRMLNACRPHAERFITPMAAVAGSVADEILAAMLPASPRRAYVNNGGDIALHLTAGTQFRVGLVADVARHGHGMPLDGDFELDAAMPVRGVATSGWRGRSFSFGIADSVTVLAADAAAADAAATMIANEVDVDDAAVVRRPACELADDTDLGARPVTVSVGTLPAALVLAALTRGASHAESLRARGLIHAAVLTLQSRHAAVGPLALPPDARSDPAASHPCSSSLYCDEARVPGRALADHSGRVTR